MPETLHTYNSHARKESFSDRWLGGERRKGEHRRAGRGIMALLSRMHRSRAGSAEGTGARPNATAPAQSYEQSLVSLQTRLRSEAVSPVVRGVARPEVAQQAPRHAAPETPRHAAPEAPLVPDASAIRPEIPVEPAPQPLDKAAWEAKYSDPTLVTEAFAHDQHFGPDGSPRHLRQEQEQPDGHLMAREPGVHYNPAEDVSQMPQRDYDAHRIVQHDNSAVGRHRAPEPGPSSEASGWFAGSNTRR